MNNVELVGRIAQDIELRKTNTGKSVTTFSLAVDRSKAEGTDFFYIVAWEHLAENMALYCRKGDRVGVIGRLASRTFEKNGEKRTIMEVIAEYVEFYEKKRQDNAERPEPVTEDELPF